MARQNGANEDYVRPIRRLAVSVLVLCLFAIFLLWRIDSPRAERFRAELVDWVVPNMEWAMVPVTETVKLVRGFQSYAALQR
ncbi:MAG: rod shape-determining protein MreC, partial [Pseudomonadota bacterium]